MTISVPLHIGLEPRCSRDCAGAIGESLFQLCEWLKTHHAEIKIDVTTQNNDEWQDDDWQKAGSAIQDTGARDAGHGEAVDFVIAQTETG